MTFPFNARQGLIVLRAEVEGPWASSILQLALDTGATTTVLSVGLLIALGYDPALSPRRVQVTTGSGVEFVPCLEVNKINALGQQRTAFPVYAHTLPPSANVDGLLGLDFFRDHVLTIDFQTGQIALA